MMLMIGVYIIGQSQPPAALGGKPATFTPRPRFNAAAVGPGDAQPGRTLERDVTQ